MYHLLGIQSVVDIRWDRSRQFGHLECKTAVTRCQLIYRNMEVAGVEAEAGRPGVNLRGRTGTCLVWSRNWQCTVMCG